MTINDRIQRAVTIRGLRDLASFLETHPDIPAPSCADVREPLGRDDRDAVVRIAEALEVGTQERDGHISTERHFGGGVSYKAFSVSSASMARHMAEMSYHGCVVPEQTAVGA